MSDDMGRRPGLPVGLGPPVKKRIIFEQNRHKLPPAEVTRLVMKNAQTEAQPTSNIGIHSSHTPPISHPPISHQALPSTPNHLTLPSNSQPFIHSVPPTHPIPTKSPNVVTPPSNNPTPRPPIFIKILRSKAISTPPTPHSPNTFPNKPVPVSIYIHSPVTASTSTSSHTSPSPSCLQTATIPYLHTPTSSHPHTPMPSHHQTSTQPSTSFYPKSTHYSTPPYPHTTTTSRQLSKPPTCEPPIAPLNTTNSPYTPLPPLPADTARSQKLQANAQINVKPFSIRGRPMNSKQQAAVVNVHTYFSKECLNNGPLLSLGAVKQRTADALNIHAKTVGRIVENAHKGLLTTPGKKRKCTKPVLDEVDDFMKANIRHIIYTMYAKGQKVTMDSLLKQCQVERIGFKGKASSLRSIVLTLGFKWKKTDNRRVLMESPKIVLHRIKFLRSYLNNMDSNEPKPPIFLDETWLFQRGTIGKSWQDEDRRSAIRGDLNDGRRFIVVHAGGRGGFVPNSSLLFASGSNTGDYHGEMNSNNFECWLENMLGNLEEPSIIIMDNASYHSVLEKKQPTSSWKKEEIVQWLQEENIGFPVTALKPELLDIARRNKRDAVYRCDTLIRNMGHEVLRLPPYHCHFNPIELVWATTKTYYNENIGKNGEYTIQNTKQVWEEALATITPEEWAKRVDHCERLIRQGWEQEMGIDRNSVAPLIINLQEDSDDETDTSVEERGNDDDDDDTLAYPLDP